MSNNGYTSVPNVVFDVVMPIISKSEYKVYNVIVRRTIGWQRIWDTISISQFVKDTGLSTPTVIAALKKLGKGKANDGYNLIYCRELREKNKLPRNQYSLNYVTEINALFEEFDLLSNLTSKISLLVKLLNENTPKLLKNFNTQNKEDKEKKNKEDFISTKVEIREEGKKSRFVLSAISEMFGIMFQVNTQRDAKKLQQVDKYDIRLIQQAIKATERAIEKGDVEKPSDALAYIVGCLKNMQEREEIAASIEKANEPDNKAFEHGQRDIEKQQQLVQQAIEEAGGEEAYREKLRQDYNAVLTKGDSA